MTHVNRLGYIYSLTDAQGVRPLEYTTAERTALSVERGTIVFDSTLGVNYYWDGTQWQDTTMSPVELKLLTAAEVTQLTNINATTISAAQWGYVGANDQSVATTGSPRFLGLLLEETGVGTDTIRLEAPAVIGASYTLTLPVDDGNNNDIMVSNGSGVLSWVGFSHTNIADRDSGVYGDGGHTNLTQRHVAAAVPTINDDSTAYKTGSIWVDSGAKTAYILTDNAVGAAQWEKISTGDEHLNSMRTYYADFTIAGDDAPVVNPTMDLVFAANGFKAKITLISADHADDRKVASLELDAVGGKWTAGAGNSIVVGNIAVIGDVAAQFSNVVSTTATTVRLTKTAGVTEGSYKCHLYVQVIRGQLTQLVNSNTAAVIAQWSY